jgi:hypothetical protein
VDLLGWVAGIWTTKAVKGRGVELAGCACGWRSGNCFGSEGFFLETKVSWGFASSQAVLRQARLHLA